MTNPAHPPPEVSFNFWRSLQAFAATRLMIASVLLIYLITNLNSDSLMSKDLFAFQAGAAYLFLAFAFSVMSFKWLHYFRWQLFTQLALDLMVIALLYAYGGAKNGLAILYLFPLAGAAILAPLVSALFFAALASIILLLQNAWASMMHEGLDPNLFQSGLYGVAFFAIVFVLHQLAARLIRQESLAFSRGRDLQRQIEINRLVIADMQDGILVIDDNAQLFAVNPAAGQLLGISRIAQKIGYRLFEFAATKPIVQAFYVWKQMLEEKGAQKKVQGEEFSASAMNLAFANTSTQVVEIPLNNGIPTAPGEQTNLLNPANTRRLQLRFVKVSVPSMTDTFTVIFLEDVSQLEDRAQQLKLASMGRLTASIAHEVRNPLAAIAYASSLLTEELNALVQTPENHPTRLRFLKIIDDNVARLNRMVEDILQLSRKVKPADDFLSLQEVVQTTAEEFQQVQKVEQHILAIDIDPSAAVYFDSMHLREVIWNLLSNALRYASGAPQSISIFSRKNPDQPLELHVQNDGALMTEQTRRHLFEPFFTTETRGTGLGLYLARELCLNNDANLSYEYRGDVTEPLTGRFIISFSRFQVTQKQITLLT